MRQSRTIILLGATVLVLAGAGFEAWPPRAAQVAQGVPSPAAKTAQPSSDSVDVAPAALHNMDLHLARADLQPLVRLVHATGVVAFNELRMAQLSPPARGRIQSIEVAVGQPVRAGQPLALLDGRRRLRSLHASSTRDTRSVSHSTTPFLPMPRRMSSSSMP
jgi:multidrug efflux pump subunit AcrA (membrane-fusion protein)